MENYLSEWCLQIFFRTFYDKMYIIFVLTLKNTIENWKFHFFRAAREARDENVSAKQADF